MLEVVSLKSLLDHYPLPDRLRRPLANARGSEASNGYGEPIEEENARDGDYVPFQTSGRTGCWALSTFLGATITSRKIGSYLGKLIEGGLQVLDDLAGEDCWIGEVGRIAETVEISFVAFQQIFVGKATEALRFDTFVTIHGVVACPAA